MNKVSDRTQFRYWSVTNHDPEVLSRGRVWNALYCSAKPDLLIRIHHWCWWWLCGDQQDRRFHRSDDSCKWMLHSVNTTLWCVDWMQHSFVFNNAMGICHLKVKIHIVILWIITPCLVPIFWKDILPPGRNYAPMLIFFYISLVSFAWILHSSPFIHLISHV
jgi:hypothetical protein